MSKLYKIKRAFTLVELLLVVTIIAVVVSATLGLSSALSSQQVSVAKNDVMSTLDYARRLAIKEKKSTVALFLRDVQSETYYIKILVEIDSFLPAASSNSEIDGRYLSRFVEVDNRKDQVLGNDVVIRVRSLNAQGTAVYWQTPDDISTDEDDPQSGSLAPLIMGVRYNPDGSLFTGDLKGNRIGVYMVDGDPRNIEGIVPGADDEDRTKIFQTFERLIIYSKGDAQLTYKGDIEDIDKTEIRVTTSNDIENDFDAWLRLSDDGTVKRIVIQGKSGKANTQELDVQ